MTAALASRRRHAGTRSQVVCCGEPTPRWLRPSVMSWVMAVASGPGTGTWCTAPGSAPARRHPQPGGLLRGTDAAVAAPVGDELGDGGGERAGDGHVVAAELDERLLSGAGDLAGGHDGDARWRLAVKQQQAAGDPVGGVERVVVQQPGGVCPSLVLADGGAGWACRGGDVEPLGVPAGGGPGQEVPGQAG